MLHLKGAEVSHEKKEIKYDESYIPIKNNISGEKSKIMKDAFCNEDKSVHLYI